jgi:methylaspartate mutase sigma subunit
VAIRVTGHGSKLTNQGARVVIGVVGNDTHVVACRVLAVGLSEFGMVPINLGTNNQPADFADAALETDADAVLVSSLNGEADHWCRDFRTHFEDRGQGDLLLYIGGNLMIGDRTPEDVEARFQAYGFDRVFHRTPGFGPALDALSSDLKERFDERR